MNKKCSRCRSIKSSKEFYHNKNQKKNDGFSYHCKSCRRLFVKESYQRNKEKRRAEGREYMRRRRESNPDLVRKLHSEFTKSNKGYANAKAAKRRAKLKEAIPVWANVSSIKIIYQKAAFFSSAWGITLHVDHIVPINSEYVCGLHCEDNLQILEQSLNCSKGNIIDYD